MDFTEAQRRRVAELIRGVKEQRGLTQKRLAELLGVNQPTLHGWEKGLRLPQPKHQKALADFLEMSVQELLFGDESTGAA